MDALNIVLTLARLSLGPWCQMVYLTSLNPNTTPTKIHTVTLLVEVVDCSNCGWQITIMIHLNHLPYEDFVSLLKGKSYCI